MHLDTSKMALESGSEIGNGTDSEEKYVAHLKKFWSQDHKKIYIYICLKKTIYIFHSIFSKFH
jgi:hypothetical protein